MSLITLLLLTGTLIVLAKSGGFNPAACDCEIVASVTNETGQLPLCVVLFAVAVDSERWRTDEIAVVVRLLRCVALGKIRG
jgi:hypothetical protein